MQATGSSTLNTNDLVVHGFSPSEIAALIQLRERYDPFREFFESNLEFERLAFLKWRHGQGQFQPERT